MATKFVKLKMYRVALASQFASSGGVFGSGIWCESSDGDQVVIAFIRPGAIPPFNQWTTPLYPDHPTLADILLGVLFVPSDQAVWFLDVLRNETAWVLLDTDLPQNNYITTEWAGVAWGHPTFQ